MNILTGALTAFLYLLLFVMVLLFLGALYMVVKMLWAICAAVIGIAIDSAKEEKIKEAENEFEALKQRYDRLRHKKLFNINEIVRDIEDKKSIKKITQTEFTKTPDLSELTQKELINFTETCKKLKVLMDEKEKIIEEKIEKEQDKAKKREKQEKKEFGEFQAKQNQKGLYFFEGKWLPKNEYARLKEIELGLENDFMGYSPFEFEEFIAELFKAMGYTTEVTKKTGDYGIDVIARKSNPEKNVNDVIAIQVKRYAPEHLVSNRDVQRILGAMKLKDVRANKAILVTTSDFTRQAEEQAEDTNVELWAGEYLKQMVRKYLIDSKLKPDSKK